MELVWSTVHVGSIRLAVELAWKAYCRGDDGTQTWRVREQMNPIQAPFHVADPLGR